MQVRTLLVVFLIAWGAWIVVQALFEDGWTVHRMLSMVIGMLIALMGATMVGQ